MAEQRQSVILGFAGGWATDFGPSFTAAPQNGALMLPFLREADNVVYELDGGVHKVGGSTRLNASAVDDGADVVQGVFDYWFQGTSGSETQKRVAVIGSGIYKEDVDGVWDQLNTGFEESKDWAFSTFNDDCILCSSSTTDGPFTWNGSEAAAQVMTGSPPEADFMVVHKNRMWAAGAPANPSRLYYSASLLHEDWTGSGSGSIDIDPEDGDRITGLRSHKNELIVFKGPNRLSIHRITGSAPTGTDAFARVPYVTGVSTVSHNSIITIGDDLAFLSPRGLHSLAATSAFGDYIEAFLSRPILTYIQDSLNHNVFAGTWGVNYQTRGVALWSLAKSGGTTRNLILGYDYRFQPGRWFSLGKESTYVNARCLAILQVNKVPRCFAGLTTGFVQRIVDVVDRSLPGGGAYSARVVTPYLNFGSSARLKTAAALWSAFVPKGNYSYTVGWTRDNTTEQTDTVNQAGGDTLA